MKIVFMGTPDYAVETLNALISAGHSVAAVFAQPDKPVGRKHIITAPPVKVCAQKHGIAVYQPNTLRDGGAEEILKQIAPDVIVVVAYGKILPPEILRIPKYGCVNGHPSLLPKYRGSAPVQWAIISGETVTGVTSQLMDEGIDTGDILETAETEIGAEETADELFGRLSVITAGLLVKTLADLESGNVTPRKQEEEKASYAPIIKKEMALLDFKAKTASEIRNAVRGFYSWPCAYFFLDGKRIKVIKAAEAGKVNAAPGTVTESSGRLVVACAGGTSVSLETVQPESSRPMSAGQMLCGRPIACGTVI